MVKEWLSSKQSYLDLPRTNLEHFPESGRTTGEGGLAGPSGLAVDAPVSA